MELCCDCDLAAWVCYAARCELCRRAMPSIGTPSSFWRQSRRVPRSVWGRPETVRDLTDGRTSSMAKSETCQHRPRASSSRTIGRMVTAVQDAGREDIDGH